MLDELEQLPDENGVLSVALTPQQMKITYSAVKLLFNDLQRQEADEIDILRKILDKLPDEHVMRAIIAGVAAPGPRRGGIRRRQRPRLCLLSRTPYNHGHTA